jgi:hypothetical protein
LTTTGIWKRFSKHAEAKGAGWLGDHSITVHNACKGPVQDERGVFQSA